MDFEKWWKEVRTTDRQWLAGQDIAKQAFQAATKIARDKALDEAADIANNLFKYEDGYHHYREDVGDAILKLKEKP